MEVDFSGTAPAVNRQYQCRAGDHPFGRCLLPALHGAGPPGHRSADE